MGATDTDYDMPIMLYLRGISVRDLNHVLESIYKGNLNCAGIIDAALNGCNFPAKEYTSLGSAGGIYHFRDRILAGDHAVARIMRPRSNSRHLSGCIDGRAPHAILTKNGNGLRDNPDTGDDFFRLNAGFIQRIPLPYLRSGFVNQVVACAVVACAVVACKYT